MSRPLPSPNVICLLAALAFYTPILASQEFGHLFFLDVSGSMKDHLTPTSRVAIADSMFPEIPMLFTPAQSAKTFTFTTQIRPVALPQKFDRDALRSFVSNQLSATSGDTDLDAVLDRAASETPANATNLAWILTDNINDPHGSGSNVDSTREFFSKMFLRSPRVQRIYFFPLEKLPIVLYLLVVSDRKMLAREAVELDSTLDTFARHLKIGAAVKAKPVDERSLAIDPSSKIFAPDSVVAAKDRSSVGKGLISAGIERGTLVVYGFEEGEALQGAFEFRLKSLNKVWRIKHAVIEKAELTDLQSRVFKNASGNIQARMTPDVISELPPGSATEIVYSLRLGQFGPKLGVPAESLFSGRLIPQAPWFHWPAFAPDGKGYVEANLVFNIGQTELQLQIIDDPVATERIKRVFHLEDFSFFVKEKEPGADVITRLDFAFPVRFEVKYRWWFRWFIACVVALVPVSLVGLVLIMRRSEAYVLLSGQSKEIRLTRVIRFPLLVDQTQIAYLRLTGLGAVFVTSTGGTRLSAQGKPGFAKALRLSRAKVRFQIESGGRQHAYEAQVVPKPAGNNPKQRF